MKKKTVRKVKFKQKTEYMKKQGLKIMSLMGNSGSKKQDDWRVLKLNEK